MNTGERIRQCRKIAGLTQAQLAEKVGMSLMSIRRYESGERTPNMRQLLDIAKALDISPVYFLDYNASEDYMPSQMQEAREREHEAIEEYNNMSPQMRETLERERKAIEEYNNMSPKMREFNERLQDAAKDCMPPQIQETFGSQHKKDSYPFGFFFFFDDLNEEGQQEALKRVEELTHIPKYQKKKD